jgi:hypothetical protein
MDESSDRKRFWQDREEDDGSTQPSTASSVTEAGKKKACQQGMSWWTSMLIGADYQFKTAKSTAKPP